MIDAVARIVRSTLTADFDRGLVFNKRGRAVGHMLRGRARIELNVAGGRTSIPRSHAIWLLAGRELVPGREIDHINRDKADDRLSNLRSVTHAENARNARRNKRNKSGVGGIVRRGRILVLQPKLDGRRYYLGTAPDLLTALRKLREWRRQHGIPEDHSMGRLRFSHVGSHLPRTLDHFVEDEGTTNARD